jgi:hypothetical protein
LQVVIDIRYARRNLGLAVCVGHADVEGKQANGTGRRYL